MKTMDCIIIGGGIAGLQAAIQLGRYKHSIMVIDSNQGRSTICKGYQNILGWPDGVSGEELRKLGKIHAEKYGVEFLNGVVISLQKEKNHFLIQTSSNQTFQARTVFLATGLVDHLPKLENLLPCLGKSIYVCPDCDGYEVSDKKTIVLGSGNTGASMAATLTYWTNDVTFINHTKEQPDSKKVKELEDLNIEIINETLTRILLDDKGNFAGVELENGKTISGEKGFTGFSGNKINAELAEQVGVNLNDSRHIIVNPRTKETSVEGIWAGGDLTAHSEQVTISMGDGSQAAIWIHKRLLKQKREA